MFALRGFAGKPSTTFFRQFHCRKHCFRRTRLYCAPKARLQHRRRKCPWGALLRKTARLTQQPNFRPQITPVILKVPTISPQLEQYNRVRGNSVLAHATGGPKSRQLHYGEHVQSGHVSPPNPRIKARFQRAALEPFGLSFFHIFLQTKKDMAPGGPTEKRIPVKT